MHDKHHTTLTFIKTPFGVDLTAAEATDGVQEVTF
jgi:hypothetical protein